MVNAQVCFNSNTFLLFLAVNIAIIAWSLYRTYQQGLENQALREEYGNAQRNVTIAKIKAQTEQAEKEAALNQIENIIDRRIRQDNGVNGINAVAESQTCPSARYGIPINTPTRGEPSDFYVVGYIYRKRDPDRTMKLLERYLYHDKYEYCTLHHNDPAIKIPVYTHNYYQLTDGDRVRVQGYKGSFKVSIYPDRAIRVIPY